MLNGIAAPFLLRLLSLAQGPARSHLLQRRMGEIQEALLHDQLGTEYLPVLGGQKECVQPSGQARFKI